MLAGAGSRPSWSCGPVMAAQLGMGQVERKVKNLTRDGTRRATANTLEWKKWKTNHEEHRTHTTLRYCSWMHVYTAKQFDKVVFDPLKY